MLQDVETKGSPGRVSVENVGPAFGGYRSAGLFQTHVHVSCEDANKISFLFLAIPQNKDPNATELQVGKVTGTKSVQKAVKTEGQHAQMQSQH